MQQERNSKNKCKVEFVPGKDGDWKLKFEPGSACQQSLEEMTKFVGPSARRYLKRHMGPGDEKQSRILNSEI